MNTFQRQLYDELIDLCANVESFYYQDFVVDDITYRVFDYRLAAFTDWLHDGARSCRGTMFVLNSKGEMVRLAALPAEKFFNHLEVSPDVAVLAERLVATDQLSQHAFDAVKAGKQGSVIAGVCAYDPFVLAHGFEGLRVHFPWIGPHDFSKVAHIQEKADGSLMSTYDHCGQLRLKSKGSVASEQCIAAMQWLDTQPAFKQALTTATMNDLTVNLEWCSQQHRIVLNYQQPTLKVINVRCNLSGRYLDLTGDHPFEDYVVDTIDVDDPATWIDTVADMQGIEGFVITFESGQRIKIKCDWYLSLHHLKDSINAPRRLFEAIIDGAADDLRASFHDSPAALKDIDSMERFVVHHLHEMTTVVSSVFEANKHLLGDGSRDHRKQFVQAIRADARVTDTTATQLKYFSLIMQLADGRDVDYKHHLRDYWKALGLLDAAVDPSPRV